MLLAISPLWWDRELQSSLQTHGLWRGRGLRPLSGLQGLPGPLASCAEGLHQPPAPKGSLRAYYSASPTPGSFYKYRFLGPAENQVLLEQMLWG